MSVLVFFAAVFGGIYLALWLMVAVTFAGAKLLKNEWDREFFADQFYGYRLLATFGVWK